MLASIVFRGSKRLTGFLRYIVEQTLANGGADLKERTIGVQVFGRAPEYDTSVEPVVRVSAGDLRKRIAQYYHESGRDNEVRIDLPTGSYHPVFRLPAVLAVQATEPSIPALPDPKLRGFRPSGRWRVAVGVAIGLAGLAVTMAVRAPGNPYDQFWAPVLEAAGPVLVYVGERPDDSRMVFEDAVALSDLTGDLRAKNRRYRILNATALAPDTLKQGPLLLIGGLTNPLALRLTQQLRFTFAHEGEPAPDGGIAYIQDRQDPVNRAWAVNFRAISSSETFTDYAILARVIDPVTDRIAVTSAGIGKYGTLAAAEFLSHPDEMKALADKAPRDWRKKNMQAVLATGVTGGKAGPARVVSAYFW